KDVSAPLPGVIVAILVKPGDKVSRGQELCTLEAMKMKNAIRSSREGTIASVDVAVGDQVSHGQVLMTFSE
ncbi:MAG TPA: acetyl-CoA carboxylase biotin carboxyl carrier protein subunit, partial [Anaerolineaceae bacterium]|nr:acetyl-CoA carboxylase biotin carboxyl carrier protein subunit [Anaerolineaceae bacterium]